MIPRRMVVLVDVDGVVGDFVGHTVTRTNALLGKTLRPDDVNDTYWFFDKFTDEEKAKLEAMTREPGYAASMPLYPGALTAMHELQRVADVHFVTSPLRGAPTWAHERSEWLARHFGARHEDVVSTAAKHLVQGDMFVDDKVSNVERWAKKHPDGIAVYWTHEPYTRRPSARLSLQGLGNVLEVRHYVDLVHLVRARAEAFETLSRIRAAKRP